VSSNPTAPTIPQNNPFGEHVEGLSHRGDDSCGSKKALVFSTDWVRIGCRLQLQEEHMAVTGIVPQLRTTDMASSIRFYTEKLGFSIEFNYQDFYTGIRAGDQIFHLKLVDEKDPSIPYVEEGEHFHLYLETNGLAGIIHSRSLRRHLIAALPKMHLERWSVASIGTPPPFPHPT
jgi:hypothetical protein